MIQKISQSFVITEPNHPARPGWHKYLRLIGTGLLSGMLLFASACGDNLDPDAAIVDAGPDIDAGIDCPQLMPEACADDSPCTDTDQTCVAGVCVASCGQDLSGLEAGLADDLAVVANLCVEPAAVSVYQDARPSDGCATYQVYNLSDEIDDDGDLTFALNTFALDPEFFPDSPAVSDVGAVTIDIANGVSAFASSYLAISPAPLESSAALFGYTTNAPGFAGDILRMPLSDGSSTALTANGNFDVDWIDDQRYLINGVSAGSIDAGQGLYYVDLNTDPATVAHAVTGFGDFSGGITVDRARGLVFAGGFYLSSGDRVYLIPLGDIEAAVASGTPLDAEATAAIQRFEVPSSFTLVGDHLVNYSFADSEYQSRPFTIADSGVATFEDPALFAQAPFDGVTPLGPDHALLHHSTGMLVVELAQ